MARWLASTLYDVRDDDGDLAPLMGKLSDSRHSDWIPDGVHSSLIQGVPVLRKWFRILHCLSWDKYVCVIWELGSHCAFAILKIQLHLFSPRYVLMISMYSSG